MEAREIEQVIIYDLPGRRGGASITRRIKQEDLNLMSITQLKTLRSWIGNVVTKKEKLMEDQGGSDNMQGMQ